MKLDHLAVVCRDLDVGCAWAEARLGVSLQPGGQHARFGTHNRLLRLGTGEYLEVIAPDPNAAPFDGPRWFALDDAPETPRLGNWIVSVPDIAAACAVAPVDIGRALALQRGDLVWSLTVPEDGSLPWGGAYPTVIQWGDGGHPAERLPDAGVRLTSLMITHPMGEAAGCGIDDARIHYERGKDIALHATFDTPNGPRSL